jgi:hypothetical protein
VIQAPICFSPHLHRARNLVERFFNKVKQRGGSDTLRQAREALTLVAATREAVFGRPDWQLARLRRELETAARSADEAAAIIAKLAAMASGAGCR